VGEGARRTASVLVMVGLVAGCSGPLTEPAARPSRYVEQPEVSSAARDAYGPAAEEAYEELARFVLDESIVLDLLDAPTEEITAEELNEGILNLFASESRSAWETRVGAALSGDAEAQGDVQVLRLHDLQVPEGVGLAHGDPVRSQVVTEAAIDVVEGSGDGGAATASGTDVASRTASAPVPLSVAFRHQAVIALRDRGGSMDLEVDRFLSFEVVPAEPPTDDVSWLIRSYEGDVRLTAGSDELPLTEDEATASAATSSG
jgi:hypothetical protein